MWQYVVKCDNTRLNVVTSHVWTLKSNVIIFSHVGTYSFSGYVLNYLTTSTQVQHMWSLCWITGNLRRILVITSDNCGQRLLQIITSWTIFTRLKLPAALGGCRNFLWSSPATLNKQFFIKFEGADLFNWMYILLRSEHNFWTVSKRKWSK